MKHIVCFHLYNDYSGSPTVLKMVLDGLLEKEVKIDLVTSKDGVLDEMENVNLKIYHYSYSFSTNPIVTMVRYIAIQIYTFFFAFKWIFDKDVIFYINTILPIGPAISGRIMGKQVVYHYHENAFAKSKFYKILAAGMQEIANNVICVSQYQASFLKRKNNISVIPNAVPQKLVDKLNPDTEEAFKRKKVLMLGSLKQYKGTKEFTELAKTLQEYQFELVINDTQENIDKFWKEKNIPQLNNLKIHPRQSDVSPFYNNASLVLNLSNKELAIETFGLTVLEAMSAGLPVIVPTVGGIAELVEDRVNGYKIDVQDFDKIAEHIHKILTDKELYISLSKNALELSKKFDGNVMIDRIMSQLIK